MKEALFDFKKRIKGKRVIVVGLGRQGGGVDAASFFSRLGAKVIITDLKPRSELQSSVKKLSQFENIRFVLGEHRIEDFERAELVVKGPSIPWDSPYIKRALELKKEVYTSASLFLKLSPTENLIGITGTRGKTTTSYLAHEVLKTFYRQVYLTGNIPNRPFLNLLLDLNSSSWVVIELSSWQLSGFSKIKLSPHIAIFTNFYPDHLNFYSSLEEYLADKINIYKFQKKDDYLLLNEPFNWILKKHPTSSKVVYFKKQEVDFPLNLKGEHNRENAAAILALARILNLDLRKTKEIIVNFKGVLYRLEKVGELNRIVFINDTTSTTPVATSKAIEAFEGESIYLVAGGDSKNLPIEVFLKALDKVKKVVFLKGDFTEEVFEKGKELYGEKVEERIFGDLKEAVERAYTLAVKGGGGVILFSPAATSFSLFKNEFERGKEFNRIVKEILKNEKEIKEEKHTAGA